MNNTECTKCPVAAGTHKPAEAVHEIAEPTTQQPEALRLAESYEATCLSGHLAVAAELRRQHARIVELEAQLDAAIHPTQQGMDDLHKQMLKALESVGAHTVTDCDGDEITAYFCNWQAISDAKRAAQAKQGVQANG